MAHWYNGQPIHSNELTLPIDDPGLLYGATIFTTLRVYRNSLEHPLTAWTHHCDRLRTSIADLGWISPDWSRIQTGALWLMTQFPVLRITLFPDGREWITGRPLPPQLADWQQHGVAVWLADAQFQRSLPQHKTGNYLAPWLARAEALRQGAQDAILVNAQGHWLETSTGNLWGWKNGQWWTPPLEAGILPGIGRSQLISGLKCQNRTIAEEPWDANRVQGFEAIAYCNSVIEVLPIHTVISTSNSYPFDAHHPCFCQLRKWFMSNGCPEF
jgi:branched-subunit amino acid aminotransferase/4-amino-4-deoxychorismate lyase